MSKHFFVQQYISNSLADNNLCTIAIDGKIHIIQTKSADASIFISLDYLTSTPPELRVSQLSYWDKIVADAVYTLYQYQYFSITHTDVFKVIYGKERVCPSKKQLETIDNSLNLLSSILIRIDCTKQLLKRELITEKETKVYEGCFLPLSTKEVSFGNQTTTLYTFERKPPIYDYSTTIGQVIAYRSALLSFGGLRRQSQEILCIKFIILHRISVLKNPNNINLRNSSFAIIYVYGPKGILSIAGIDLDKVSDATGRIKSVRNHIALILDDYAKNKVIKGYDIVRGRKNTAMGFKILL